MTRREFFVLAYGSVASWLLFRLADLVDALPSRKWSE